MGEALSTTGVLWEEPAGGALGRHGATRPFGITASVESSKDKKVNSCSFLLKSNIIICSFYDKLPLLNSIFLAKIPIFSGSSANFAF